MLCCYLVCITGEHLAKMPKLWSLMHPLFLGECATLCASGMTACSGHASPRSLSCRPGDTLLCNSVGLAGGKGAHEHTSFRASALHKSPTMCICTLLWAGQCGACPLGAFKWHWTGQYGARPLGACNQHCRQAARSPPTRCTLKSLIAPHQSLSCPHAQLQQAGFLFPLLLWCLLSLPLDLSEGSPGCDHIPSPMVLTKQCIDPPHFCSCGLAFMFLNCPCLRGLAIHLAFGIM